MSEEIEKSDLWKDEEVKNKQFYSDNPEEEEFPWSEAGIRCMIEIKKQREEIEELKKIIKG